MAYSYINSKGTTYYLHNKEVKLRSGRDQMIYYFAKQPAANVSNQLPQGYVVIENQRTGLPVLKKA